MEAVRLNLVHEGDKWSEVYKIAQLTRSNTADPHFTHRIDERGTYRWIWSAPDGEPVASRGFSTLFEEWQSTGDSTQAARQFTESHAVPWIEGGAVRIERRFRDGFRPVFTVALPRAVADLPLTSSPSSRRLHALHDGGPIRVLMVAEGFTADEEGAFLAGARRACDVLLNTDPFSAAELSCAALFVPSERPGIPSTPADSGGTAFRSSYGSLGMARYLVVTDLHALAAAVDGVAFSTLVVLANASTYGGSGIFNMNCVIPVGMDDPDFNYVLPHELGHSLAGLGDEYFGKEVTYDLTESPSSDPWEPNVSLMDAFGRVKWRERVPDGVPVPTPWCHSEYLRLISLQQGSDGDASRLSRQVAVANLSELLAREPWANTVGVFEGARYQANGMYRSEVNCRIFSQGASRFCGICRETIARALTLSAVGGEVNDSADQH